MQPAAFYSRKIHLGEQRTLNEAASALRLGPLLLMLGMLEKRWP
jgi:hypothetical protein